MILEWLQREGWMIFNWWLLSTLAGVAVLPLCAVFLRHLPDSGFTLARPIGLVVVSYTLWMLTNQHLLKNTPFGIVLAWLIVGVVSAILYRRSGYSLPWRSWWRAQRWAILTAELIFILVFFGWSIFRAVNNDIHFGEKPMNAMLMSSIMKTTTFPPEDAWLSGYPLNYYYFGALVGAELSLSANTSNMVGVNLWTAMVFALTAVSTFGVVYNLVASRRTRTWIAVAFGVIGVLVVNVMSNYQPILIELPYELGKGTPAYFQFWDVRQRETPRLIYEEQDAAFVGWSLNWWFYASRVVKDRVVSDIDPAAFSDSINEFPAFSFVVAENHAHTIALFFTLIIIGLGFNITLDKHAPDIYQIFFYALLIGSLYVVNAWNYPVGLTVIIGAEILRRFSIHQRLIGRDVVEIAFLSGILLTLSLVAYAPFVTLSNPNVQGLAPNLYQGTRLPQMILVLGALLPLTIVYVYYETYRASRQHVASWYAALWLTCAGTTLLIGLTVGLTQHEWNRPDLSFSPVNMLRELADLNKAIPLIVRWRLEGLPTLLLCLALLTMVMAVLLPFAKRQCDQKQLETTYLPADTPAASYSLLLIGIALLCLILPEFVYVFDMWAHRATTVFKFYILAWLLLGIAATYGLYSLTADRERKIARPVLRIAWGLISAGLIVATLPWFGAALWSRMIRETGRLTDPEPPLLTLDGGTGLVTPDDHTTLRCLQDLVQQENVVVASGVYSNLERYSLFGQGPGLGSGRVGALTGIPTLLGWGQHEMNWRAKLDSQLLETRVQDTRTLYTAATLDEVHIIIDRYHIDYILYGDVERNEAWYGADGEKKFLQAFPVVCASGESRIFKIR